MNRRRRRLLFVSSLCVFSHSKISLTGNWQNNKRPETVSLFCSKNRHNQHVTHKISSLSLCDAHIQYTIQWNNTWLIKIFSFASIRLTFIPSRKVRFFCFWCSFSGWKMMEDEGKEKQTLVCLYRRMSKRFRFIHTLGSLYYFTFQRQQIFFLSNNFQWWID